MVRTRLAVNGLDGARRRPHHPHIRHRATLRPRISAQNQPTRTGKPQVTVTSLMKLLAHRVLSAWLHEAPYVAGASYPKASPTHLGSRSALRPRVHKASPGTNLQAP